jgi:lysozyme
MTPRHQVSRAAIELIKRFEGYRRKAAQLPDGRWTIGYGHTLSAREGAEVSEADAEALLLYDLIIVARTLRELVYAELTRNQFDALCAFAFSIGLEAFRGSDVLKRVNEGAFTQAAFGLELWRRAAFQGERIVVDALVRRRAAEKLLFLTPDDGVWRPAPSAVLKPELDEAGPDSTPREAPAELVAALEGDAVAVARSAASAPEPAGEPQHPVTAAAEAVSARLQTLFPEPAAEPPPDPAPEPEPEPEPAVEAPADAPALLSAAAAEPETLAEAAPAPASADASAVTADETPGRRILIDDTAPYEFVPPPVQPLDLDAGDGVLGIVTLGILGVAFFAGGIFWGLNAPPASPPGVFTPLLVGWLAGVAGVGFVAAAVFMLLQRMTRAAERRDRRRP